MASAAAADPVACDGPAGAGPRIQVLGTCLVDGRAVNRLKAVEFATALAVAGGTMCRDRLQGRVYERDVADSTLPTLAYRARQVGIDVRYDRDRKLFRLACAPVIDALVVLELADAGRAREALELYTGPCLPASHSPFAEALRYRVESRLTAAVLETGDPALARQAERKIDCWELAEPAMHGDDAVGAVLGHSYLRGHGLLPGA